MSCVSETVTFQPPAWALRDSVTGRLLTFLSSLIEVVSAEPSTCYKYTQTQFPWSPLSLHQVWHSENGDTKRASSCSVKTPSEVKWSFPGSTRKAARSVVFAILNLLSASHSVRRFVAPVVAFCRWTACFCCDYWTLNPMGQLCFLWCWNYAGSDWKRTHGSSAFCGPSRQVVAAVTT